MPTDPDKFDKTFDTAMLVMGGAMVVVALAMAYGIIMAINWLVTK